jgi:hypothetical protein
MAVLEEIIVDHITLTASDVYNKFVMLSRTPTTAAEVSLSTDVPQDYDLDYWVDGKMLRWEGKLLDTGPEAVEEGDVFHIIYSTENALNLFEFQPQRDDVLVTSTINMEALQEKVGSDPYYNSASKIDRVDIMYLHEDLRESKTIIHFGTDLKGRISWSPYARSGLWRKMRVRVRDTDGAVTWLYRQQIGEEQDLILT